MTQRKYPARGAASGIAAAESAEGDGGGNIHKARFAGGRRPGLRQWPGEVAIAQGEGGLMSLTGLPKIPLMVLAACCGGLAYTMTKNEKLVGIFTVTDACRALAEVLGDQHEEPDIVA